MGFHAFKPGLPGYPTWKPDMLDGELRGRDYAGGVSADAAEE
jgi:hypothetical protein